MSKREARGENVDESLARRLLVGKADLVEEIVAPSEGDAIDDDVPSTVSDIIAVCVESIVLV